MTATDKPLRRCSCRIIEIDGQQHPEAALDPHGKLVRADEADAALAAKEAEIATLRAQVARLREALDECAGVIGDHLGECYPVALELADRALAATAPEPAERGEVPCSDS